MSKPLLRPRMINVNHAKYSATYREKQEASGLVQFNAWVPSDKVDEVKDLIGQHIGKPVRKEVLPPKLDEEYNVYWLHWPEHRFVDQEGYVGATKELDERMDQHELYGIIAQYSTKRKPVYKTNIFTGPRERALEIEGLLRPKSFTGWNTLRGGFAVKPYLKEAA